jgi:uncharacterized protein YodC (DUF2158 family)
MSDIAIEEPKQLKSGNLVRLKTNGQTMVVKSNNNGRVISNYFDKNNEIHEEEYDENELTYIRN